MIDWANIHEFICEKKKEGYTWKDISDCVSNFYNIDISPNACRCREQRFLKKQLRESGISKTEKEILDDSLNENFKLQDYMTQAMSSMRRISREDTLKEIANNYAEVMANKSPLKFEDRIKNRNDDMQGILCISDWHYGIVIDNYNNQYNTEIAKKRIQQLFVKTVEYIIRYKLQKLFVINLGDMIAGRIHSPIKMESRIDSVTQIMEVSELIAQFLQNLSAYADIEYYEVLDNHSRLEPNVKESLDLESLARITGFYLKQRLKDNSKIIIQDNKYSKDILTFNILGHNVAGVHGDKDKQKSVINSLTLYTKEFYDLILTAHLHHVSMEESTGTIRVSNGSLMGTDSYAVKLRLFSPPSQNLIIVTKDNPMEAFHRILLD